MKKLYISIISRCMFKQTWSITSITSTSRFSMFPFLFEIRSIRLSTRSNHMHQCHKKFLRPWIVTDTWITQQWTPTPLIFPNTTQLLDKHLNVLCKTILFIAVFHRAPCFKQATRSLWFTTCLPKQVDFNSTHSEIRIVNFKQQIN